MSTQYKEANVYTVPKKGNLSLVSNHRPISLLNSEDKLFERLVFKYLFQPLTMYVMIIFFLLSSKALYQGTRVNQLTFLCKEVRAVLCNSGKRFIVYGTLDSFINYMLLVTQERF